MTRDETIAILKSRLNRTDSDIDTILVNELRIAQEQTLEGGEFLPWFLLTTDTSQVLLADEATVSLPTAFIRFHENRPVRYKDTTATTPDQYRKVSNKSLMFLLDGYEASDTGSPEYWALQGRTLIFRPYADINYGLGLRYFAKDTSLATDTTNNWLTYAQDWLMAETGYAVASTYLEDEKKAAIWQAAIARAKDRVWRAHEAFMAQAANYSMGDD